MATNHPLIVIIYDSVNNPVFESQVLAPVVCAARSAIESPLASTPTVLGPANVITSHHITEQSYVLISFERSPIPKDHQVFSQWPGPVYIVRNYLPFLGLPTLQVLLPALKKILRIFPSYEIRARGPHAGWLATHAATSSCLGITIQARGLLGAEYEYVHRNEQRKLMRWIHAVRKGWYESLEKRTYASTPPITIEAVSPALKEYLATTYHTTANITLAQEDMPQKLSDKDRLFWREKLRKELSIPLKSIVYCYSGSAKPWQCPEQTVAYFAQQLAQDNNSFLLLLTQDTDAFVQYLTTYQLPTDKVRIISVPAAQVMHYLAAADKGIVLRDKALMNWVSRPTKALEYQAAGLEVIHNNTVEWLADSENSLTTRSE